MASNDKLIPDPRREAPVSWLFVCLLIVTVAVPAVGCSPDSSPTGSDEPSSPPDPGAAEEDVNGGGEGLSSEERAIALKIAERSCQRCHDIEGERLGLMRSPGFLFTAKTLPERMKTETYAAKIEALKARRPGHYEKSKEQIDAILAEPDLEKRQELWLRAYLKNTRFDDEKNTMLYVHLEPEEVDVIVKYILNLD